MSGVTKKGEGKREFYAFAAEKHSGRLWILTLARYMTRSGMRKRTGTKYAPIAVRFLAIELFVTISIKIKRRCLKRG
jgi:hypothetical protein